MAIENGGRAPHPNSLDTRLGRLEATVEFILETLRELKADMQQLRADQRRDFRFLIGLHISTTLALVTIMAKGFGWL